MVPNALLKSQHPGKYSIKWKAGLMEFIRALVCAKNRVATHMSGYSVVIICDVKFEAEYTFRLQKTIP
jgi:hypothetical protein